MKGLAVHALLAALGLLLAYQTWSRPQRVEEAAPSEEVTLLACKPEQLERIELRLPTHKVELWPETSARGTTTYWLTSQSTPKKDQAPSPERVEGSAAGAVSGGEGESAAGDASQAAPTHQNSAGSVADRDEPPVPQPRKFDPLAPVTFRGNRTAAEVVRAFLPLRAMRALGVIEQARHADFGLDAVGTHLRVACGGQQLELEVAGRTYGNNDHYVRNPKTGITYLMHGQPFVELQSSQFKLMQNELHEHDPAVVDEAVVSASGQTIRLLQRERMARGHSVWVDAGKPEQRNEAYGNWFARLARLRLRVYLPRGAEPGSDLTAGDEPVTVVTVDYLREGKSMAKLELARATSFGQTFYYARTETTESWVSVLESVAREVEADLPLVVGEGAVSAPPP